MGNNTWRNWFGNTNGEEPDDGKKFDGNVNGGDSVDSGTDDFVSELNIVQEHIDELDQLLSDLESIKSKFFRGGSTGEVGEGTDEGARVELTDDELIDSVEFQIPTVRVKTEFFEAEAIEMYEMPYGQVLDLITAGGPRQMFKMLDMFRLAVIDQTLLDDMELLTFNEISEVVGQWAAKSTVRWMSINVSGDDGDDDVRSDS